MKALGFLDWVEVAVASIALLAATYLLGSVGKIGTPHHAWACVVVMAGFECVGLGAFLLASILWRKT